MGEGKEVEEVSCGEMRENGEEDLSASGQERPLAGMVGRTSFGRELIVVKAILL